MITTAILNKTTEQIRDNWSTFFSSEKPDRITHLTVNRSNKRACIFYFDDKSETPFAFGKITSFDDSYESFMKEYRVLQSYHAAKTPFFIERTARPLFVMESDDQLIIVMTNIYGKSIGNIVVNNAIIDDITANSRIINAVQQCWIELVAISDGKELLTEEFANVYFSQREEIIKQSFEDSEVLLFEFNRLKKVLLDEYCGKITLGPVHGDFWKDNLIFDGEKVFLIDWERFNPKCFQLVDMFLFCSTYSDHDFISNCALPFQDLGEADKLIRTAMLTSASRLGLSNYQAAIMFELFLFEMCVQGHMHYGLKITADENWKQKLLKFIPAKEQIHQHCFGIVK